MILNFTPHAIHVEKDGVRTVFASCGIARVSATNSVAESVDGFECVRQQFGAVSGLPDAVDGTFLIVSGMVLSALAGTRSDVIAPRTDVTAIRENGQIVAVTGFCK